jgi:hypothetical protein
MVCKNNQITSQKIESHSDSDTGDLPGNLYQFIFTEVQDYDVKYEQVQQKAEKIQGYVLGKLFSCFCPVVPERPSFVELVVLCHSYKKRDDGRDIIMDIQKGQRAKDRDICQCAKGTD